MTSADGGAVCERVPHLTMRYSPPVFTTMQHHAPYITPHIRLHTPSSNATAPRVSRYTHGTVVPLALAKRECTCNTCTSRHTSHNTVRCRPTSHHITQCTVGRHHITLCANRALRKSDSLPSRISTPTLQLPCRKSEFLPRHCFKKTRMHMYPKRMHTSGSWNYFLHHLLFVVALLAAK